jgi:hypothetical protein
MSIIFFICNFSVFAQDIETPQNSCKSSGKIFVNIQKYLGLNLMADLLGESLVKGVVKIKTRAERINVNLEIYSALDLILKKIKSFNVNAEKLLVEDVPVENIKLSINDPICIRKKRVLSTIRIYSLVRIDLNKVNEVINNLPKWEKVFSHLELPVPPFGDTEISINNISIKIDENGRIDAFAEVRSILKPESEPLELQFTGNLATDGKKLVAKNIETEIKDIFTKDSDIGIAFSKFLEDLINPIFNFGKYEKNGLTIDTVKLSFESNNIIFEIESRLLPEIPA